ncbi:G-protein coupled receptor 55 [Genypterus blacodes]|uniref:G-protein coupled receptor 55 n=1 Tax=Genypterus blacodes TaxID=154954 RepID=UPI003F76AB2C
MTSNCSFEEVDYVMKYLELAIYIPIFLIGLSLNIIALVVFCLFLRRWTETTIYMTSLALMDLLLLLPLPFKMHATNHCWSGQFQGFCSFLESLYFVGMYGSIYTIMCIAVDRWVAIRHPFKAKQLRSPKVARRVCMVVWVLALASVSPTMYRLPKADQGNFSCFHRFSDNVWSPLVIICVEVFGFLAPALVVVCCSIQTICALQQSGQNSPKSRACVKIIYSSLSAFLVPFTPIHLAILLQFLVHQKVIEDCGSRTSISLFIQVAMCLGNISCCLDALCYYFIAHEVRSTKHTIRLSLSQRRGTLSSVEV